MFEIEQKFRVESIENVIGNLTAAGFSCGSQEKHIDTYLRHPVRNFAETGEAFRLRQVNESMVVTYKGKREAGEVKIRTEIELPVGGDFASWMDLWAKLGFSVADEVRKIRDIYTQPDLTNLVVAVDQVEDLGNFVEIETLVDSNGDRTAGAARVTAVATALDLGAAEPRSYLRQLLELKGKA